MLCFGSSFSPFLWVFGFDSGTRQISTFVVVVLRDPFVPTLTVLVETAPGADLLGSIKTVVSKAVLPSSAHASIATSPAFQGLALTLGIPAEVRTMSPWAW